MPTLRRFFPHALLISLASLAGCSLLPVAPSSGASRAARGGFTVMVDGPGQPASARVLADIGAFAQRRGYARQSAGNGTPERYVGGNLILDLSRDPAEHRVIAYLHSAGTGNDRKIIDRFDLEFAQEYTGTYGPAARISETAYADDSINGSSNLFGKPVDVSPGASSSLGAGQL